VQEQGALDPEAQKEILIQALLDQAFVLNNQSLTDYIQRVLLDGRRVSSRDLPIREARDLLAAAHIIELGAINHLSSNFEFHVTFAKKEPFANEYFSQVDDFVIELREKAGNSANA
jgi:hypothetical protein